MVIVTKIKNIVGRRFGKLVVIKLEKVQNHFTFWLCRCDCGGEKVVRKDHLLRGETRSCGCLEKTNLKKIGLKSTHGQTHTLLYFVWNTMRQRCRNPNTSSFKNYGGRGIKVCREWNEHFEPFYKWAMANGYKHGLTIDRIDTNGNYEPKNCRWVTNKIQQNNKRSNVVINGKTITQWAESKGLKPRLVMQRLESGWTLKQALDKHKHINQFI